MMDDDIFESPSVTENTSETGGGDSEYGGGGGEYGGFGLVPPPSTDEFKSPMAPPKPLLTDMMKNPSKVVMLKVLLCSVINPIRSMYSILLNFELYYQQDQVF